jgi:hypothetical protein
MGMPAWDEPTVRATEMASQEAPAFRLERSDIKPRSSGDGARPLALIPEDAELEAVGWNPFTRAHPCGASPRPVAVGRSGSQQGVARPRAAWRCSSGRVGVGLLGQGPGKGAWKAGGEGQVYCATY